MIDLPFERRHLMVDGHKIAYFDEGDGPPVLLIHGIPTSSLLWRNIIPGLTGARRVIAPDMLNYGWSGKPERADVSIAAQARVMLGVLDALGVRRADVVAHDIGGGVAQIMAVQRPERIGKLVLSNSVCFDSWPIPEFKPLQAPDAESQMSLDAFVSMMREFLPQGVHDSQSLSEEAQEIMLAPWSSEEGKRALFRNFRRLNPEYTQAIASALPHLDHKTMVLWGRHDPFQKPEYAEKLAATIPHAELRWIDDGAHWLMEEKPQAVADNLRAFLG